MDSPVHSFRVTPETLIKLKLLKTALKKSITDILEEAVDMLCEANTDRVSETITKYKVTIETKKVLQKLKE